MNNFEYIPPKNAPVSTEELINDLKKENTTLLIFRDDLEHGEKHY